MMLDSGHCRLQSPRLHSTAEEHSLCPGSGDHNALRNLIHLHPQTTAITHLHKHMAIDVGRELCLHYRQRYGGPGCVGRSGGSLHCGYRGHQSRMESNLVLLLPMGLVPTCRNDSRGALIAASTTTDFSLIVCQIVKEGAPHRVQILTCASEVSYIHIYR
ncbi:hypothetical protein K440DRAFT_193891 [Wilcoxina mikolae CBS 423.85]|nr:hypothetical protein K440DRAFT_193891 [Wilcoxina mikolae CBS 423.85]